MEFLGHSAVLAKDMARPLAVGRDVGEDLALLAACNSSILSYGTFGMWAAILAGGNVVMSPTMARTKEGEELREGGLPGWMWLEEEVGEQGERSSSICSLSTTPCPYMLAVVTILSWTHTIDVFRIAQNNFHV